MKGAATATPFRLDYHVKVVVIQTTKPKITEPRLEKTLNLTIGIQHD